MSFFTRFSAVFRSWLNALVGRMEDPAKLLEQTLVDMKTQFNQARGQVAAALADEKRLRKQLDAHRESARQWEQKAMLAVRAGKDALAKEALERQAESTKLALCFEGQWNSQAAATEQLQSALQTLQRKIDDAGVQRALLLARMQRAQAQSAIAGTLETLGGTDASSTLGRVEDKIARAEAEAAAQYEVAGEGSPDFQAQFAALENVEVDDALLALKSKMGMAPVRAAPERSEVRVEVDLELDMERDLEQMVFAG